MLEQPKRNARTWLGLKMGCHMGFDVKNACEMILSVKDWNPVEHIIYFENRYFTFFRADTTSSNLRQIRNALIDLWNEDYQFKDGLQEKGFVLLEHATSIQGRKYQARLNIHDRTDEDRALVGLAYADLNELVENYRYAKGALFNIGVCQNDVRNLIVDDAQGEFITLNRSHSKERSFSTSVVNKLKGSLSFSEHEISSVAENKHASNIEASSDFTICTGAVRSAMIMNAMAEELGIATLSDLSKTRLQDGVASTVHYAYSRNDFEFSIYKAEKSLTKLDKAMSAFINSAFKHIEANYKGENHDTRFFEGLKKATFGLYKIQSDFSEKMVTAEMVGRADALRDAFNFDPELKWMSSIGEMVLHALVLKASYQHFIAETKKTMDACLSQPELGELDPSNPADSCLIWMIKETKRQIDEKNTGPQRIAPH